MNRALVLLTGLAIVFSFDNMAGLAQQGDSVHKSARSVKGLKLKISAMDFEGAYDMGLIRKLFELRPWYRMLPDQSVIALGQGEGEDHIQAARAEDGSFLLAYLPFGHRIGVHMDPLSGRKVKAQWYDPREGTWIFIGQYSNVGVREFVPPSNGDSNDWLLVLDDVEKNYPLEFSK